jgi:hypothetical protein
MKERALRFDLLIAVSALLISTIAALASVLQTRAIQDQYAAAIWPYLSVDSTVNVNGVTLDLTNDGLGPALIRSGQLYLDGRSVSGWEEAMRIIFNDPKLHVPKHAVASAHMSSLNASTTIRPGDSHRLLSITLSKGVPITTLLRHEVAIDVCYCSLNDRCWTLHSVPGGSSDDYPHPISRCTVGARILAGPST